MRFCFVLACFLLMPVWAQMPSVTLPPPVMAQLDARYPGWKLAPIAPQIEEWFAEARFSYRPNLVGADFDGDGKRDYVVELVSNAGQLVVVGFMAKGDKFEMQELAKDAPDPFTYLLVYEKGSKDFDFKKMKPFRHLTDSLGLMYFTKTPYTFMYRSGKFRKTLAPSDEEFDDPI
jgi:hypothetical protein